MSTSTRTFTLSLARSENGNWSLTPSASLRDTLPPMAFPASMSPSEAQDYAQGFLPLAHVPAPAHLDWHRYGITAHDSSPAYRAAWTVTISDVPAPAV